MGDRFEIPYWTIWNQSILDQKTRETALSAISVFRKLSGLNKTFPGYITAFIQKKMPLAKIMQTACFIDKFLHKHASIGDYSVSRNL